MPEEASQSQAKMVTLDLSVSVIENLYPRETESRAPFEGDNTFENTASDYEKLESLRVVIVRSNGIIEHNRIVHLNPTTQVPVNDDLKFKVISGEYKTIYLFGNEQIVKEINNFDFETALQKNTVFPAETVSDLVLTMGVNNTVIDNSATSQTGRYLPMSEAFDVFVDANAAVDANNDKYQSADLFLTRSLIKFSFHLTVGNIPYKEGTMLDGITIDGLADESYYLPRNTVYSPQKNQPSVGGRYIVSFVTPKDVERKKVTFPIINPIDMSIPGEYDIVQYRYFPETSDGTYNVSLLFRDNGSINDELTELVGNRPLEISNIARNTHVKVNISTGEDGILLYDVIVEPWTPQFHEIDFTHNVAIADDGALTFTEGTYASLDKSTGRLVMNDYPQAVSGSFGISQPLGCRWYAYLVTTSGELGAIKFVTTDADGHTTTSDYITGIIDGKKTDFKVAATMSAGNAPRTAILQVMVTMADGLSVPVNILKSTEYGSGLENITFIQNQQ